MSEKKLQELKESNLLQQVILDEPKFKLLKNDKKLREMVQHFEKAAPASFGMTHFDLARVTGVPYDNWNEFLHLPSILNFINTGTENLINSAQRNAIVNLGDAEKSVDIQKIKVYNEIQNSREANERRPFNILFMPAETKKFRDKLVQVRDYITDPKVEVKSLEKIYNMIVEVIGRADKSS